ncbi:MAG: glycosyltransferase, partial [Anaerolineales bacterium]|nr:glycosyltransferase [Anaerolineales bacterium]
MSRALRVCHVATLTGWGGVERMLIDFLTQAPLTQRHLLLTTSSAAALLAPVQAAGVPHFEPRRRWRYDPAALLRMARWLRRQGVQVVHTYNAYANAWGGMAARLARVPVVAAGEQGPALSAARWAARVEAGAPGGAAAVVANSSATAQIVQLRYGVAAARVRLVPNGVPPLAPAADLAALRAALGLPAGAAVIGSIGRLDMPKHFQTLVETAVIVL